MKIVVLLQLEVDIESLRKDDEPDDHIRSKIRAYIADVVGHAVVQQEHIALLSSSLATEIEPKGTVQIQPSNPVLRIPPETKIA